jgi:hypothetical protein
MATPIARRPEPGGESSMAVLPASVVLGVWVLISSFILAAKYTIAAPAYWSNSFSGAALAVVALAGLATLRRASR